MKLRTLKKENVYAIMDFKNKQELREIAQFFNSENFCSLCYNPNLFNKWEIKCHLFIDEAHFEQNQIIEDNERLFNNIDDLDDYATDWCIEKKYREIDEIISFGNSLAKIKEALEEKADNESVVYNENRESIDIVESEPLYYEYDGKQYYIALLLTDDPTDQIVDNNLNVEF